MKLELLIEWDGPFPTDVASGRFDNLRATCLSPGYQVQRHEYKGIWLNLDDTISFFLELEIRSLPPPARLRLAPLRGTTGQLRALPSAQRKRSHTMSTTPPIVALPLSHPNEDWQQVHDELKTNDASWRNLAFDGIQADGQGGLLENRRCPGCGSTLGRAILPMHALEVCQQVANVHARSLDALSSSLHLAQTKALRPRRSRS